MINFETNNNKIKIEYEEEKRYVKIDLKNEEMDRKFCVMINIPLRKPIDSSNIVEDYIKEDIEINTLLIDNNKKLLISIIVNVNKRVNQPKWVSTYILGLDNDTVNTGIIVCNSNVDLE